MTDKPMLNGLTEAETSATASCAGLSVGEALPVLLPIVMWTDSNGSAIGRHTERWLASDIALTPHAPAQAIIERLEAACESWNDLAATISMERDEARAELAELKAKQVADIEAVMDLAQAHANAHAQAFYADPELAADSDEIAGRMKLCDAAREALRAQLTKDRT